MAGSTALVVGHADAPEAPLPPRRRAVRYGELVLWRGLLPVLPGLAVFLALFRPLLNPWNVDWLFSPNPGTPDVATSQLGWLTYADDSWHWPLGSNPAYGGDVAASLLFTDSLPAFSAVMKLIVLASGVDQPVQTLGLSLLVCLVLQSATGYALVRVLAGSRAPAVAGAAFLSLAPALLLKWNIASLFWQWLVLAGMLVAVLQLPSAKKLITWSLLVIFAVGITPYVAVMLIALGSMDVLMALRRRHDFMLLLGIPVIATSALFGLYLWGTFAIDPGSGAAGGLGEYSADALAIFDSAGLGRFVGDLPGGNFEGFAYLGAGVLLLLLAGATSLAMECASRGVRRSVVAVFQRRRGLAILAPSVVALAVLSTLPRVSLAGRSVSLSLPEPVVTTLSTFRANGRFLWPLMYTLIVIAVLCAVRVTRARRPYVISAVLTLALVVQIVDLLPLGRYIRFEVDRAVTAEPLFQKELAEAFTAPGVTSLEVVPAVPHPPTVPWREIGLAAHKASLPLTSVGYFNRIDVDALLRLRDAGVQRLVAHELDPSTVYVVQRELYADHLAGWQGAEVLFDLGDDWVVLRSADEVAPGGGTGAQPSAPTLRPMSGFGRRETDDNGQGAWWMTAASGVLEVRGSQGARVAVPLRVVPTPCRPLAATFGDTSVIGAGPVVVELEVVLDEDGSAQVPVKALNEPCRPPGETRDLRLLVYEPTVSPVGQR